MNVKSLYINLPVDDLGLARSFWSGLGFSFNDQFSDDKAICLILKEDCLYAMLITKPFFATFTNRPVADSSHTQVLLAIEVDSREQVDEMVSRALKLGGARYRQGEDHGWMYYDSFADPDGHQWEVLFSDPSKMPEQA